MTPRFELARLRGIGARLALGFGGLVLIIAGFAWLAKWHLDRVESQVEILWEEWLEASVLDEVSSALGRLSRLVAETRGVATVSFELRHAPRLREILADLRAVDWKSFLEASHVEDEANLDHEKEELVLQSRLALGIEDLVQELEGALAGIADRATLDVEPLLARSEALQRDLDAIRTLDASEAQKAQDRTEAYLRRVRRTILAASGGGLLLATGLSVLIYRSVRRPLRSLRGVVARYAEGRFEERSHFDTPDEIGELSRDLNRMAEQLDAAYAALERKVEQKTAALLHSSKLAGIGTLASGIAHEVNNPLNTIAGCTEGLRKRIHAVAEDKRGLFEEYLRIIAEETARASGIARGLLDFAGERSTHRTSHDVGTLLAQVVEITGPRARELGIEVGLQVCDEVVVHADAGKLRQVFFNLVQNALEASQRGQFVRIEVRAREDGRAAEVTVRDEGEGIEREQLERIYDPFFTTKQDQGGTGLGLSVCYGIVEEHGGHITAESAGRGRGATLRVVLPGLRSEGFAVGCEPSRSEP